MEFFGHQPQADLATGAIRGVEALIRWQHPQRGLLPASEFIEAAEQTGLIADIRRLVIESSAAQWETWRAAGSKLDIAVNLSAVDLLDPLAAQPGGGLVPGANHGQPAAFHFSRRTR